MLHYKFKSTEEILNFILNTTEFLEYEVVICQLSTSNGLNLDINTKTIGSANEQSYTLFKYLVSTVKNFYDNAIIQNGDSVNIHLKFKLPKQLKNLYDEQNEYEAFFINIYSDNINISASSSSSEKTRDSSFIGMENWDTYFANIYTNWYNSYILKLN